MPDFHINLQKAIVLGGTHDHIRLIKLLQSRGFWVILIDFNTNPVAKSYADIHLEISTTEKENILEIARQEGVSIVVSTSIESAIITGAYVTEHLGLPYYLDYDTAIKVTSKSYMKAMFERLNIPSARHVDFGSNDTIEKIEGLRYPLVIKPADANSSKGVTKIISIVEAYAAILTARAFSPSEKVIVEEYVQGRELSVDVMVVDRQPHILMISESEKSEIHPDKFTIVQSNYPVEITEVVLDEIGRIAKRLAEDLGYTNGPLLIQMIENKGNINVIEFSARLGGGSKHHFVLASTGYDVLSAFVDLLVAGKLEKPKMTNLKITTAMIYLYAKEGVFGSLDGTEASKRDDIVSDFFQYMEFGTQIKGNTTSSDRPCGFLVSGKNDQEVKDKIHRGKSGISIKDPAGNRLNL
jgi:phosphoribosylamine-glycine ligase